VVRWCIAVALLAQLLSPCVYVWLSLAGIDTKVSLLVGTVDIALGGWFFGFSTCIIHES
jgi:hypothetical protein